MFTRRMVLACMMLMALLAPAVPIAFAQDALIQFPVAVAAVDGSYEVEDGGDACRLIWEGAGTPTLRVYASGGARSRSDLDAGTLMTLPDVDEELACVFEIEVEVPQSRNYDITIEGSDLITVTDDDIEDLEGTMVLPIELEEDGEFVMTTDEYLDLDIEEDAERRPVEQDDPEPEPESTPEDAPDEPESTPQPETTSGAEYTIVGRVNLWADEESLAPGGCFAGPNETGIYPGAQVIVRDENGAVIAYTELTYAERSGSTVCSYDFTVDVPEAQFYAFEFGNGTTIVRSIDDLQLWNWHIYIDTAG